MGWDFPPSAHPAQHGMCFIKSIFLSNIGFSQNTMREKNNKNYPSYSTISESAVT